jgi:hypothetical protein
MIRSLNATGYRLIASAGELRFAHGVNTRERLARVTGDARCDAIEADVSWGFLTGAPGARLAVMAHPPIEESDLSFEQWLEETAGARVIKIDIKDVPSNRAVLDVLCERRLPLDRYILNSDVVAGAGGPPPLLVADAIEWRRRLGDVVISIGCTTGDVLEPYRDGELDAVLEAAGAIGGPVTVCLELHRVEAVPDQLERVRSSGYHVTIWNQFPALPRHYRHYRRLLPDAIIDLFDDSRDPILE